QSKLTVTGVAEGTATITVTAQDADGNTVSDPFDVTVNAPAQPEPVQPQPIESETEHEPQLQQQAAQLPGAVTNLTVEPRNTRIIVSWEAPTEGGVPTGYIAHIQPVGGGRGHTMTPDAEKTTIQFRRLDRATEYLIWVRAVNEEGKGDRTRIRTATK
ncbi:MAG: fibronectin type III domain-containing protein, partial [Chloroflexi bacterium]|nr:fibronectin type III domain-containing protein [Chloroflexota bacterium]